MRQFTGYLLLFFLVFAVDVKAQEKKNPPADPKKTTASKLPRNEKEWLQSQIDSLTSPRMFGRGYVNGGRDSAAKYIIKKLRELKVQPMMKGGLYTQGFAFPVNTFPGDLSLSIDGKPVKPGTEFIVDPSSSSLSADGLPIKKINLGKIKDTAKWTETLASFDGSNAYYFENIESLLEVLQLKKEEFLPLLPKGCYIIPQDKKLTWSVSRQNIPATVLYVRQEVLRGRLKSLGVNINSVFVNHATSQNIIGVCPGVVKDTFILVTSHYDHLGMMGDSTLFPGATDDASGVAMMLSLASYFSLHPQHYSVMFIAFAGEEASLMGSEFYVYHPIVPLKDIRFMLNIGIMADATDGISVVNGTEFPQVYSLLDKINTVNNYVPKIYAKGPAANGDHYHFSEAGVPAFFFYSNGGNGFYHDVYDKPEVVSLTNISAVAQLLIDLIKDIE